MTLLRSRQAEVPLAARRLASARLPIASFVARRRDRTAGWRVGGLVARLRLLVRCWSGGRFGNGPLALSPCY
jgi:hypothetical protein